MTRLFHRLCLAVLAAGMLVTAGCYRGEAPVVPEPDPSSLRSTPSGDVVGFTGRYGSHVWLGLPFAAPPVGELRWRAPRPPAAWQGAREALAVGSLCTQFSSALEGAEPGQVVGDEDCLYLNVYAPRFEPDALPAAGARLPVMVWIHGGGNSIGHAGFYDGGHLAARENVVVVTVNYRLGPFGWLRHAALRGPRTDAEDRSGNYGTLDLIRALEWVRGHVAAFGGDPRNVTIFGESAGGTNVFSLLLSPRARGLFHRAIVQSGGLRFASIEEAENRLTADPPGHPQSSAEIVARLMLERGRVPDREAAWVEIRELPPVELAAFLRELSAEEIMHAYGPAPAAGMIDMPEVFRDGTVLPAEEPLARLARRGGSNPVPVILGTNRDENRLFMFADERWVRRILWIFWRLRDEPLYGATADALSRMWKANGADEPAAALHSAGHRDVWVYRFDWDEEPSVLGADLSVMLGAAHAFEIPFVFGHFDLGRRSGILFDEASEPGRLELSARMMGYWARFAREGDPGDGRGAPLPAWRRWTPADGADRQLVFDTDADGGIRMTPERLTPQDVLDAIAIDERVESQTARCSIYAALARRSNGLSDAGYAERCPGQPLALEAGG